MSLEEGLMKAVERAATTVLTSIKVKALEKEIQELRARSAPQEENLAAVELKDAAERLKISVPKLKQLITVGEIKAFTPPGGRLKIVNVSLNDYIRREAGM